MSQTPRRGESSGYHLRSARCVLAAGRWFITTREGIDVGPYDRREDAEQDASRLAQMLDGVDDPTLAGLFIREFQRRSRVQQRTR